MNVCKSMGQWRLLRGTNSISALRPVVLLFSATLVCLFIGDSIRGQNGNAQLCQTTQEQIDKLAAETKKLENELAFTSQTETSARDILSTFNKAIVDPKQKEALFRTEPFRTPRTRQQLLDAYNLPWSDDYEYDQMLLLKKLRDTQIERVERIKYVLVHKAEVQQQKADNDRQLANLRSRLTELRCNGGAEVDLAGTWVATIPSQDCTLLYTMTLRPSGFKSWSGPLTAGGNCKVQPDVGTIGNVTLMAKGAGVLTGVFSGNPIQAQFKNSQILMVLFGEVAFVKKK